MIKSGLINLALGGSKKRGSEIRCLFWEAILGAHPGMSVGDPVSCYDSLREAKGLSGKRGR